MLSFPLYLALNVYAQLFKDASDVPERRGLPHVSANAAYHTGSSLSGGSFTCCNGVYMSRLQERRGGGVFPPTECHVPPLWTSA